MDVLKCLFNSLLMRGQKDVTTSSKENPKKRYICRSEIFQCILKLKKNPSSSTVDEGS